MLLALPYLANVADGRPADNRPGRRVDKLEGKAPR